MKSITFFRYGNGGTIVADLLSSFGVEFIFTIAGSQTLPLMHSIKKRHRIKIIVSRNERNSVFMAEGYGIAVNFPAVSLSTLGPGIANELPALYSALKNQAPVISISPSQPLWKIQRLGEVFQGLDHQTFLKKVVKSCYQIHSIDELPEKLTLAFKDSLERPCGPVHVDISFPILFRPFLYYNFKQERIDINIEKKMFVIFENHELNDFRRLSFLSSLDSATELYPGDPRGALPFSLGVKLGVKNAPVLAFITRANLLRNPDTLAVAKAAGIKPLIITFKDDEEIKKIAKVFDAEYQYNFNHTFLQKSHTINILII